MTPEAADVGTPKGIVTRAIQATSLALLFGVLWLAARAMPESDGRVGSIAAVGFLLLGGTLTSELVEIIGLPHLTGYLLAGIVAGPHVLKLIAPSSVEDLSQVNALALALIALEGGAHLRTSTLRQGAKALAWATVVQHVFVLVAMSGVVFALHTRIPFTANLATTHPGPGALLAAALLWGMLAITRSPPRRLEFSLKLGREGPSQVAR